MMLSTGDLIFLGVFTVGVLGCAAGVIIGNWRARCKQCNQTPPMGTLGLSHEVYRSGVCPTCEMLNRMRTKAP